MSGFDDLPDIPFEHHRQMLHRALQELRCKHPRLAHEVKTRLEDQLARGVDEERALITARLECQDEAFTTDGAAFGPVHDGDGPAPTPKHAGGRPPALDLSDRKKWLRFKAARPEMTCKEAGREFLLGHPWVEATIDDLVTAHKYRKRYEF